MPEASEAGGDRARDAFKPLVVDANVVAYMLIEGELTEQARRLHELRPDWVCPSILRHEFINICATYGRVGGMSRNTCLQIVDEGMNLLAGREIEARPMATATLALELGISAYDAEYLAVALEVDGLVATQDRLLLERAPGIAVSLAGAGATLFNEGPGD